MLHLKRKELPPKQRKIKENKRAYKNKLAQKKQAYVEGNECKDTGRASDKCRAVRPSDVFLDQNRLLIDAQMNHLQMMDFVGRGGDIPAFSVNTESHFLVDVINSIFKTIGDIEEEDDTVISSLNGEKLNALFRELDYSIFWTEFHVGRGGTALSCPLGNMQEKDKVTKAFDCKHGLTHDHKNKYNELLSAYLDSIILILKNSNVREIPQKEYFSALFNLIKKIMTATGTNIMEVNINKWREFSQKINEIYEYNIFNISCSKGEDDYTCGRGINSAEEGGKNYILLFDTVATNDDTMNMRTWAVWSDATFPEHSRSNIEIANQIKAKQLQSLMPTGESKQVVMARGSSAGKKKGPPSRKNRGPPERRRLPTWNPQDDSHIFSTTIPIKEAQKIDQERKRIYASNQHDIPLISLPEAQLRENKRKVENFTKDKINYNPNRSFPERELDGARLANERPHRVNTRKKKKKTSLKSLKNRPPGMDGGRKTRRKKRRKTRRKKRRKTRRKNKKSKRKTKRKR